MPLAATAAPSPSTTYLGGCGSEEVHAIVVNQIAGHPFEGDVYVAGRTTSSSFDEGCETTDAEVFVAHFSAGLDVLHALKIIRNPSGVEELVAFDIMPKGRPSSGWLVLLGETDDATELPGDKPFGAGGRDDAFIAALDPELSVQLVSRLGGAVHDRPSALAIDPVSFEIYVAGETNSADFPGTEGGAQADHGGIFDAFVARISLNVPLLPRDPPTLALLQSTFLGGRTGSEVNVNLALSDGMSVYLKGRTNSVDLPVTDNAPQPNPGGGIEDLFVARLSADLTERQAVTYLGGNGFEQTRQTRLVVHSGKGHVYVAGTTKSEGTEPLTGVAWTSGGFLARFSPELDALESVAVVPVSGVDDLLQHPSGDLYLLGTVFKESFPSILTKDALQPTFGGGTSDAYIARYDAALTPQLATYFGGSEADGFPSLGVHPLTEELYLAGNTRSPDLPFSGAGIQSRNAGLQDAFLARLGADLSSSGVAQATYLGGGKDETVGTLALPDFGVVYVAGGTASDDLDRTNEAAQPTPGGGDGDGFVALFPLNLSVPLPLCVGDCDGDGSVKVNELILGVNINLERRPVGDCPVFDVDGSGAVQVNELVQAVNSNLRGCRSVPSAHPDR